MTINLDNRKNIRSFGRINSRTISKTAEEKFELLAGKYLIELENSDPANVFKNDKDVYLEIGFGYGESIATRAKNDMEHNYIGCESYRKGVLNLVSLLETQQLSNVKIFNGDARLLIEKLPDKSLSKVFVLFPDPWPKKRHHKRRIINDTFLQLIHSKLKNGGKIFFASDIEEYVDWSCELLDKIFKRSFKTKEDCKTPPSWWVITRYQQKAIAEGRESYFLEFEKAD